MGLRGPKQNIFVLEETKKLYDEHHNMETVGKILDISRERVRQRLLAYTKYHTDYVPKNEVIKIMENKKDDIEKQLIKYNNINDYIKDSKLNISVMTLRNHVDISKATLDTIRRNKTKQRVKAAFNKLQQELNYFPNTTQLQKINKSLYNRILYSFKSYSEFKKEIGEVHA